MHSSTHNKTVIRFASAALFASAAVLMGGCAKSQSAWESSERHYDAAMATPRGWIDKNLRSSQSQLDPVMADPKPDEAAVARGWEPVTQWYPNGRVIAGPNYQLVSYEDRPKWLRNDVVYSASESLILIADAVAMPFWMIVEPPFTKVVYKGATYAPSMTVAPPLPAPLPPRAGDTAPPEPVTPPTEPAPAPAPVQ